jgi:hypothetical protein
MMSRKHLDNPTPVRNTKTRRVLLQSITPKVGPNKTPARVHKKNHLTPIKSKKVNQSLRADRLSKDRSNSRSPNGSNNNGVLWIPGGHANSMGRNKLASLGKQIYLEYKNNLDSAIGASSLF